MADNPKIPGAGDVDAAASKATEKLNNLIRSLLEDYDAVSKNAGLTGDQLEKMKEPLTKFMKGWVKMGNDAETLRKALVDIQKTIDIYGKNMESTAVELGKIAKDMKVEDTRSGHKTKIRDVAAKIKGWKEEIEDYQERFLKKVLLGDWSDSDEKALIEAFRVSEGPGTNIKAKIDHVRKKMDRAARAYADGADNAIELAQEAQQALANSLEGIDKVLYEKNKAIERQGAAWRRKMMDYEAQGKKAPLSLRLQGWSKANGGDGYASEANKRLQDNKTFMGKVAQETGLAGKVGSVFEDGKFNTGKAAIELAKIVGSNAKTGLEAYKTTGRQFGMEGNNLGDIVGTYQGTTRDLAMIGARTGNFDKAQQMQAFQATSQAIRAGGADKYDVQLKATEKVLKASNSLGVGPDKLATVLGGIRKSLGGSSNSITGYLGDMKDALDTINGGVDKDMKISGEELTDLWKELSNDTKNAGINMRVFAQNTKDAQLWARQLGGPLDKANDLGKKMSGIKSGATAGSEESFGMTAATGLFSQLTLGKNHKLSKETLTSAQEGTSLDFRKTFLDNLKTMKIPDESKKDLENLMSDEDTAKVMQAIISNDPGTSLMVLRDIKNIPQILRKLDKAGFGDVVGLPVPLSSILAEYSKSVLKITGRGPRGESVAKEMFHMDQANFQALNDMAKGGPQLQNNRQSGEKAIDRENSSMAAASAAASPLNAAGNLGNAAIGNVVTPAKAAILLGAREGLKWAPKAKAGYEAYKAGKGILGAWRAGNAVAAGTGVGLIPALASEAVLDLTEGLIRGGYKAYKDPKGYFGASMGTAFKERAQDPEGWSKDWKNLKGEHGFLGFLEGLGGGAEDIFGSIGDVAQEGLRGYGKMSNMFGTQQAGFDWWSAYQNGQTGASGGGGGAGSSTTTNGTKVVGNNIIMTSTTTTVMDGTVLPQVIANQAAQAGQGRN